jgi:ABC-2 type transport system ATP-binding protein
MLSIENLTINFESLTAVDDFNFEFAPGKIHGLIGPNGAGKSSLLKACVGLISDYQGKIKYNDKNLIENRQWVKNNCGYAPEDAVLFPYLSGEEFLRLIASIRNNDKKSMDKQVSFFITLTAINDKKDELIVNYSHGMRQKLAVAAALIGNPQFIIIDESLNGLDPVALYRLKKYLMELAAGGKTIILSSHILPLIRDWCDPIVIMNKGILIKAWTKEELIKIEDQESRNFEEIFISLADNS